MCFVHDQQQVVNDSYIYENERGDINEMLGFFYLTFFFNLQKSFN